MMIYNLNGDAKRQKNKGNASGFIIQAPWNIKVWLQMFCKIKTIWFADRHIQKEVYHVLTTHDEDNVQKSH